MRGRNCCQWLAAAAHRKGAERTGFPMTVVVAAVGNAARDAAVAVLVSNIRTFFYRMTGGTGIKYAVYGSQFLSQAA